MKSCVVFLVLLCAVSNIDAASLNGSKHYDTIVVGLGASGTAAASELARQGRRVLGLEAQPAVGGRVKTVPLPGGVVEMGAEWIHGQNNSVTYNLAIQNNVPVKIQDFAPQTFLSDGSVVDAGFMEDLMNFTTPLMEEDSEEPEPLGVFMTRKINAYIKEHYPSIYDDKDFMANLLVFMDLMVNSYVGSSNWNEATTNTEYEVLSGSNTVSWHRYGYKTLFEILLNTYNNGTGLPTLTTKFKKEVTKITWPQDPGSKVVVTCKDGSEYTADYVIVTLSVGVLKERHESLFSPPLPQKKVEAINGIPLGVVDKIVLLFTERWWPKDTFTGFIWKGEDKAKIPEEDKWTTILGVSPPMGYEKALTFWTCGEDAKYSESLTEEVVKAKTTELLRKFFKDTAIPEPEGILRSTWYSNPYTRGSYTFDSLAAPSHPTLRPDLAAPLADTAGTPRILFAGEATNPNHYSTVHGAVETGLREARRLLE